MYALRATGISGGSILGNCCVNVVTQPAQWLPLAFLCLREVCQQGARGQRCDACMNKMNPFPQGSSV